MQQHKNMEKIMRTDFARFPDFWHDKHNQLIFSSILQVRIVDNRQEKISTASQPGEGTSGTARTSLCSAGCQVSSCPHFEFLIFCP